VKKIKIPKYLPKTIVVFVKGDVMRNSIVPVDFSSEKIFMVKSGIKKTNINSITLKISRKETSRFWSIIIKKKILKIAVVRTRTMYAIGDLK
jgi:hypothetical protein